MTALYYCLDCRPPCEIVPAGQGDRLPEQLRQLVDEQEGRCLMQRALELIEQERARATE